MRILRYRINIVSALNGDHVLQVCPGFTPISVGIKQSEPGFVSVWGTVDMSLAAQNHSHPVAIGCRLFGTGHSFECPQTFKFLGTVITPVDECYHIFMEGLA